MCKIPFSTFQGHIRRINLDQRPDIEIALFANVFPKFFTKREIPQKARERIKDTVAPLWPIIQVEEDLDPPRRFAGLPLMPRNRYYSICKDSSGDDGETLANELRAYRDPLITGRVGVADLMSEQLFGLPRPALAVIIYEVEKVPFAKQILESRSQASKGGKDLLILEYPCEVVTTQIERVIDLRTIAAQKWFFEQFSKETDDGLITWVLGRALSKEIPEELRKNLDKESVTIVSRFQRKACAPPKPSDFFAMLPTLMNPEQGGGIASEGGGILEAIGTWMRHNEVGALIYPSARSDVSVKLESEAIVSYRGWNIIDYRGTRRNDIKPHYIVQSPWAWAGFQQGIHIEVETKDVIRKGSFQINGIRAHLKRDYEGCVKSREELDAYTNTVGQDILFEAESGVTKASAWRIGSSSIEWLTLNAVDRKPKEGWKEQMLFSGFVRKIARSYAAGRMDEIVQELSATGDISKALADCMDITDWMAESWKDEGKTLQAQILVLSNRLHVLRFFVAGTLLALSAGIVQGLSNAEHVTLLLGDIDIKSCALSDDTHKSIAAVIELGYKLCGGNLEQSKMAAVQIATGWEDNWKRMCETTWRELCGSQ